MRPAQAKKERDAARARVVALEEALLDACREKVVHGHTTTLLTKAGRLEVPGIKELCISAEQIRSEAKTLVAELVEALEACTEWMRRNPPVNGWGCIDRGAEADCRDVLAVAEAALAKSKGTANG